ncbi:MAG: leucine-rich repeat domain-containing protein [Clostridia bacterium]|nr:leucine-rich repeat domain-containing protein [Clostridia bacterium]
MKKKLLTILLIIFAISTCLFTLTACDKAKNSLTYAINEDNQSYSVIGIGTCTDSDIIIPSTYNNKPVTKIGDEAFRNCSTFTSITIPNSITKIGDYAFEDCVNLKSVTIGDSVISIGNGAFCNCNSLTSIVIPNSVESIGYDVFDGCYRLVEIVNKSTQIIVTKGSSENGNLGYYAIAVYNSGDTFTATKLSNDNGYIIYNNGEEKILVSYEGNEKDLILPTYITKINNHSFYNYDSLTSVIIGDSVESIGNYAFGFCDNLTNATIGSCVESIGNSAFYLCRSLTSVTFNDTSTWYRTKSSSDWENKTGGTEMDVSTPTNNDDYFKYASSYWYKE